MSWFWWLYDADVEREIAYKSARGGVDELPWEYQPPTTFTDKVGRLFDDRPVVTYLCRGCGEFASKCRCVADGRQIKQARP